MSTRANALAARLEQGAQTLAAFAEGLSDAEWQMVVPTDARSVGTLVHHVASVYSGEVDLAREVASGKPITGLTWDMVAEGNAQHAQAHATVNKQETLELLQRNSRMAADRVRQFTDEELDRAAAVSLNGNAPLTAQFLIEDHALRHSFHHLANIRAVLNR
jgi:DinB superfamily